jgi:hypothetical protein
MLACQVVEEFDHAACFSVTGLKGSFASHPRRPLFPLSYPNPPLPFLLIDPCCIFYYVVCLCPVQRTTLGSIKVGLVILKQ